MLTLLPDGEAAASSSAARSVHRPAASAQLPSPGWASWASAVVLTVNAVVLTVNAVVLTVNASGDACAALGSQAAVPAVSRDAAALAVANRRSCLPTRLIRTLPSRHPAFRLQASGSTSACGAPGSGTRVCT